MTAVAPPLNFQPTARTGGWCAPNPQNGISSADDVSRMFMPSRKSVQRSNSSSSIASTASSSSTISSSSVQTNGIPASAPPDASWGSRKKPARGLWPALKAEPIAGLSTARPQSMASSSAGPSATSTTSALHTPSSMLPSQHGASSQAQPNGTPRQQNDPPAILHLVPLNGTFERKTITVPYFPEVLRIGRQTNNKTIPTPLNGYFDSKVLSRQHAEVWADRSGKVWIRDVKSSNGTFVNGTRLSPENRDSEAHELREQDMLELGIDIISEDQKTIVHHKVAAKVEHAGIYPNANNVLDLNFGDLDPAGNGNLMPSLGPGQMRGRNNSSGSLMSNGRLVPSAQNMAANNISMTQQRHSNFWLQPVTMEQIVKKLNSEMKQARQQTQELHRTGQYIESILANDHKKDANKSSPIVTKSPLKSDIKARFSEPPAPPPSQPLPEKPDVAQQPSLRRIDTEKPKLPNAKGEQSSQISSLVEALTSAKKELDVQSVRLKELEDMLARERHLRESAEEHVQRLEMEHKNDSVTTITEAYTNGTKDADQEDNAATAARSEETIVIEPPPVADADAHTAQLQQRLDSMVAEMERMRQEMGAYKLRAEKAEEDSARDRQTLAEMVESIRKDESKRLSKSVSEKGDRSAATDESAVGVDGTVDPTIADRAEKAVLGDKVAEHGAAARQSVLSNGRPVSDTNGHPKDTGSQVLATKSQGGEQLAHVGPYASMVGVVVLGLSIMAYINGWQKPLER
ncbi:cytoplasm to vacuole targeting Vps64 [Phyllosticta capitalensis]